MEFNNHSGYYGTRMISGIITLTVCPHLTRAVEVMRNNESHWSDLMIFLTPLLRLTRPFLPTFLGCLDRKLAEDYEL